MFCTIINDCHDDNARSRQESRITQLLQCPVSFVGVNSDIEAAGCLIDSIDATAGAKGLILVNVAPRGGHTTKWENGTPFAYTTYGETIIVSSVDGFALSGLKANGLIPDGVQLFDTTNASLALQTAGFITADEAAYIPRSQFRSFDFTPRIGAFLIGGGSLPSETYDATHISDLPKAVWWIDSFGNCKTFLTEADLTTKGTLTRFGTLPFYEQLRDVPDGETALIRGSSGLLGHKYIEMVTQRTNNAKKFTIHVGDDLFTEQNYFVRATN